MESGAIRDEDITASSSFDGASVGPHNARYYTLYTHNFVGLLLLHSYRNPTVSDTTSKLAIRTLYIPGH